MNIKTALLERMTIEEFAERHRLTMEVIERPLEYQRNGLPRFYASFAGLVETKHGGFLHGDFGNGDTPEEAISSYTRQISSQLLVIDAASTTRQEIRVPVLESRSDDERSRA